MTTLCNSCYADKTGCFKPAVQAKNKYFNTTYQTQTNENQRRNSDNTSELRTRNLCLNNFMTLHLNCAFYKCMQDSFIPLFTNRNLTGEQICGFIDSVDCLNDSMSDINKFLRDAGDTTTDMFLFDMDKLIVNIKSDNASLSYIDTNKEVCYSTDSNGDTVWHAFVETENSSFNSWFSLCVSLLNSDQKQYLYNAILFTENKLGETAIQSAYKNHRGYYSKKFRLIGQSFKELNIDCQPYVDSVSEQSGIRKLDLDPLCAGKQYKIW